MSQVIAIYADQGTSQLGLASLKRTVPRYLGLECRLLSAADILAGALADYAAFIIPGGADLPYCAQLNGNGNQRIRQFVEQGGSYIGICAGAYYACAAIDFIGEEYAVAGKRELAFFDGDAQGCLPQFTQGQRFNEQTNSKAMVSLRFNDSSQAPFYYHGGPKFVPNVTASYQPIAYYPDGNLAIVAGNIGQGSYLLSGVHFELEPRAYRQSLREIDEREVLKKEQQICKQLRAPYGLRAWQEIRAHLHL